MKQQGLKLVYRWQYHAFSSALGLVALSLTLAGRRRRAQPGAVAVGDPSTKLAELLESMPAEPGEPVRPAWADRLETERTVLRIAVSVYLTARAYQLARSGRNLWPHGGQPVPERMVS